MNYNKAAPMNFCACIFVSLYVSLHNEGVLFRNVEDGKWERDERGNRTAKFVHPTLVELCYKTCILCSNCIYTCKTDMGSC